jgi:predicted DsbA family dithiol-disulfide isomerase
LFEGELGDEHFLEYAAELGLDRTTFEACTRSPETDKEIGVEVAVFRQSGLRGLPTTFVDEERIGGARPRAVYVEAVERAATAEREFSVSGPVYLGAGGLLLVGLAWFGRRR